MLIWNNEDGSGDDGNTGGSSADDATKGGEGGQDGDKKPTMTDKEAALLKEVMDKKDALTKTKAELKTLADAKAASDARLAEYEGLDVERVKALLKQEQEREQTELEKKGEFDRVKAQMIEQHKKELETLTNAKSEEVKRLSEDLNKTSTLIKELTIGRAFSESPFIRESLTLTPSKTRTVYGSHFELQDGKVVAYDKPAGSETRTVLVDANGEPMSFDKAMAKLIDMDDDRDSLLRSKMKPGSGSENDPDVKKKDRGPELRGKDRIKNSIAAGGLKLPEVK
jgi:hypothetical protein